MLMYLKKEISKKIFWKSDILLAPSKPLPKRAGSGSGAISGFVIQDPKIRIRIKMSRIRSTATFSVWRGNSETDSDS
jgi:hypothetical protein